MELIGKGKSDPGAVWVARRVPDNCISGHANHSRIHTFPLKDKETLYAKDVISFARKQGYFDGKDKDFDFSRAYAEYEMTALRGCDGRVWSYFNRFAAKGTMDQYLDWIMKGEGEAMPLWIEPAKKLSSTDLKWMMRDHFEGTPLDMTKDIGAGPYSVPYRWRPMTYKVDGNEYMNERAIATQQTGFSFVADMNKNRHDAMKGILWFGTDDANTCVYLPVFSSTPKAPYELRPGNGDMLTLSWDANFWVNNYVANQAYNRYSQMIGDIRKVQSGLEDAIVKAVNDAQTSVSSLSYADAQSLLEGITDSWAQKATRDYKNLGDMLFVKYMDGNIKKQNDDGSFKRTETGVAVSPTFGGYDERYYRSIVNEQGDRLKVIEVKK
jgi:dipeptidase